MIKHFLKRPRNFWQEPLCSEIYRQSVLRRNDQEYENQIKFDDPLHLDRYGYKVYSQNDEDGIIQKIFKRIGTTNK